MASMWCFLVIYIVVSTVQLATHSSGHDVVDTRSARIVDRAEGGNCLLPDHDQCAILPDVCQDDALSHQLCPHLCGFCVSHAYNTCRDGWFHDTRSCYAIPTGAKGNWAEAMAYCGSMGSELAVVENQAEQNFLVALIHNVSASYSHDADFWLGAVDILEEGVFIWANRLIRVENYFWGAGQPDNAKGRQDCLRLEHELSFAWGDGDCQSHEYFICEREAEG